MSGLYAIDVLNAFNRIDAIRSVSEMERELRSLDEDIRFGVIMRALAHSRFQFTWSHFAIRFDIHQSDWPTANNEGGSDG